MLGRNKRGFLWQNPRFDVFQRFGQVNARLITRRPRANLHTSYAKVIEGSLIAALLLAILAFRFLPVSNTESRAVVVAQELVRIEDIAQTRQEHRPPPPPKPVIPIEDLSDAGLLEDVTIASTEVDFDQDFSPPQADFAGDNEQYFVVVEEMPQIIGGMAALMEHLVYPKNARRAGIEGRVFVAAYIDKKGNVVNTEVLKGVGSGLNEAAQRAVEQVKFIPGKQRGKPMRVRVVIPVRFQLQVALG